MIAALLSQFPVIVVETEDMHDGLLRPEEAVSVRKAVAKRRREFATGRRCARRALQSLGHPDFPIVSGRQREPVWPTDVVGSISHCDDYCVAVVARRGVVDGIGVDVEGAQPLDAELVPLICTPGEIRFRLYNPASHQCPWSKVIFSAKESVFKCLNSATRRTLDFHDVEISLKQETGTFSVRYTGRPSPDRPAVLDLAGRFCCSGGHVATAVLLLKRD